MSSIVVPVSFSDNAANAARYAADLALAIGADLYLLYVLEPPLSMIGRPMSEDVLCELRDSGYSLLKDVSEQLVRRTNGKVAVATDLETGEVDVRLKAFCTAHKPLLVVMGAAERPAEKAGNALTRVQRRLSYPLLVIPPKAVYQGIHKVVLACDEEDLYSGIPAALPFLRELSALLGARFEVMHVVTDGARSLEDAAVEYRGWKKAMSAFEPELHFVRQPHVEEGVGQFLRDHEADWLVVLPKKHAVVEFHKSKAKELVLRCPVPVMSLHEH